MKAYKKRTYSGIRPLLRDLSYLWRHKGAFLALQRGRLLDGSLRERLMLAVTEVNACRFCSFIHTKRALKEGLSDEEVGALLGGNLENVPEEQRTAVLYAQHWAETEGETDETARVRLKETYGEEKAGVMEICLTAIKTGNYLNNFLELCLFHLSFGRWGA